MSCWNHVYEDCGNQWESGKENQKCPRCGSDNTENYKCGDSVQVKCQDCVCGFNLGHEK